MQCIGNNDSDRTSFQESGGRRLAVPVAGALVCRICLVTDSELYSMVEYKNLYTAYETLTGLWMHSEQSLPPFLCTKCARLLLACTRFRAKTLRVYSVLLEVATKYHCITVENIIEHQSSLRPKPTHSQYDQCDFDKEIIKTENIHTHEQADLSPALCKDITEEVSVKSENDDVAYQLLLKCETFDDELDDQLPDDNLPLLDVREMPKLSNNGAPQEGEISNADVDTGHNQEIDATHVSVSDGVKLEKSYDGDSPAGEDFPSDVNVPFQDVRQNDELKTIGAPKEAETLDARVNPHQNQKIEKHSNHENFFCDIYHNQTNSVHHLSSHLKTHATTKSYSDINPYLLTHLKNDVNKHSRIYAGKMRYLCDVCCKSFTYKSQIIRHARIHSIEKPYSCDVCSKSFTQYTYLQAHLLIHSGEQPYSCDVCRKSFCTKSILDKHSRIHSVEKPYSCDVCSKSFNQYTYLQAHLSIHSGEQPYSCDVCSKSFRNKGNLDKHSRIHSGTKPYSCDVCRKSFTQHITLQKHLLSHTGEKPHSCDVCSKSFSTKSSLDTHMRIHSGEKPYSCDVCSKSFSTKGTLNGHLRVHSGERPYSCDVCSRSFSTKFILNKHSLTHSGEKPFSCDVCSKSFSAKANLDRHSRTHSAENPYSCDICSKSFTCKGNLDQHLRIHAGVKPYSCDVCSKSFSSKGNLDRHSRIHAGEKP